MKRNWKLIVISLCMAMVFAFATLTACDKKPAKPEFGTITGTTVDEEGEAVTGVSVYYSEEDYVESDDNGNFEIKDVKVGALTLKTQSRGYAETVKEITDDNFNNEGIANVNLVLKEGKGTIKGVVNVSGNTSKKIAGANVRIAGTALTATTNESGAFEITDVPMLTQKSISVSKDGYETLNKTVTKASYTDGVASINFSLVENDLAYLPGLKPNELASAPKIDADKKTISSGEMKNYFSVSRDGIEGSSKTEIHPEGFCLNANTSEERANMVAFMYAKVTVDDNHKFLTAHARVFFGQNGASRDDELAGNFTNSSLAELGLFVIDDKGEFIDDSRFGAFTKINTESFMPVTFDLSSLAGKTVTIILGTKTGYHCCFNRVEFTSAAPSYLAVKGVAGLTQLLITGTTDKTSFDAAELNSYWTVGGGVNKVNEGITLNGTDPWKAEYFDKNNPQPVNSYMHITTDITAANSKLTFDATILKLSDCLDPGNKDDQGPYYPYVALLLIDSTGNLLNTINWESPWDEMRDTINDENKAVKLTYDLSSYVGTGITVVLAANVGYKATITGATFGAQA